MFEKRVSTRVLLMAVLVLLSLTGIFSYQKFSGPYHQSNFLPAHSIILSLCFILILFNLKSRFKYSVLLIQVLIFCLILFNYTIFLHGLYSSFYLDFFVIYKPFIYAFILFFLPSSLGSEKFLQRVFLIVLYFSFCKYLISHLFFEIDRPGLFGENNFEVMFLILIYAALVVSNARISLFVHILFCSTILLSLSKSGIFTLIFTYLYIFQFYLRKSFYKYLLVYFSIFFLVALLVFILTQESRFDKIDRIVFLKVFVDEFLSFSFNEILFGKSAITPLSSYSCNSLSFYQALFSEHDSSVCFSVVLHSFIIRTIFDHGFFGLILLYFCSIYVLYAAKIDSKAVWLFFLIVFFNGLSVSGHGSPFYVLSFLVIILFYPRRLVLK